LIALLEYPNLLDFAFRVLSHTEYIPGVVFAMWINKGFNEIVRALDISSVLTHEKDISIIDNFVQPLMKQSRYYNMTNMEDRWINEEEIWCRAGHYQP
jgi:hypothetical protein